MKPNKHIILDILYTIPDIFPVRLSRPVKDEHGLVSMVADAIKAEDRAHRESPSLP